jgi:hypothetical protein
MAKFNLYAHESDTTVRRSRRSAAGALSARTFGLGLGVWFGVMFALACLILTA